MDITYKNFYNNNKGKVVNYDGENVILCGINTQYFLVCRHIAKGGWSSDENPAYERFLSSGDMEVDFSNPLVDKKHFYWVAYHGLSEIVSDKITKEKRIQGIKEVKL